MTDLDKLIEAVEADAFEASPPRFNAFAAAFEAALGMKPSYVDGWGAYRGSLDAAKRLHDALLPGWSWAIQNDAANVIFSTAHVARVWDIPVYSAECKDNPARAWLLAVLRAVKAKAQL